MGEDHFLNLQPGTVVNGRYEVVKCLGTGSMGMVYACRHRELSGHLVAMKVLFSEVARDDVAAQRFRNEIVASYGVSHPNVVRAYEYFRDGDLIAFTMEYIGGGDLADRINKNEPIEIEEIARMLSQMCSGVEAIHKAGIIHRDLKPENILLTANNDIKITDFGIARTGTGPKLTEHGGVVGTIDYVSPEYLERGQVDARSDIYALGVLAFEMITGEAPFKGESVIETMTMRLRSDPPRPGELRADCPPELDRIVLSAMARDPAERYQCASEMFVDLQKMIYGGSGTNPAVSAETSVMPVVPAVEPAGAGLSSSAPTASTSGVPQPSSARHTIEQGGELAQTTFLDSSTVESIREAAIEEPAPDTTSIESSWSSYERPQMESVLGSGTRSSVYSQPTVSAIEDPQNAQNPISVGQGSLSAQRMQELSTEMFQSGDDSLVRTLVVWLLIFVVASGLSVLVIRHLQPELFGMEGRKTVPTYRDSGADSLPGVGESQ